MTLDCNLLATGAQLLVALFTAFVAAFTLATVRRLSHQTRAAILLDCLRNYVAIRKDRTTALAENSGDLCRDYYRALIDLHWSEFQIWRMGEIEDRVMSAWLYARWRNWEKDEICLPNGTKQKFTYAEEWKELVDTRYFDPNDEFIEFMNYVHRNEIPKALAMKNKRRSGS